MVKDRILYDRLGINPHATETEIKKAFRKNSLKWHPDKNPKNKKVATQKFQEITEAYTILSDQEKRNLYNKIGIDILKQDEGFNNMDPSDIFAQFFGNNEGFPFENMFGGFNQSPPEHLKDINIQVRVSLKQIYNEETIKVNYVRKIYCVKCNGTGSSSGKKSTCNTCDGKGKQIKVVRIGPMIQQMVSTCNSCNGTGECINKKDSCQKCKGKSYNLKNDSIDLPLKNGLGNGNKIKLSNKGHRFVEGKTDLIIYIVELKDDVFERQNSSLITTVKLTLYQSLLGFDKIILHLDDRKLHISSRGSTPDNKIRVIKGEGMVDLDTNIKGDLYIKFIVLYPNFNQYTVEEKNILKKILSKNETKEVELENKIKNNKIKCIKTIMKDNASSNHNQNNFEDMYESGNANECVHQ